MQSPLGLVKYGVRAQALGLQVAKLSLMSTPLRDLGNVGDGSLGTRLLNIRDQLLGEKSFCQLGRVYRTGSPGLRTFLGQNSGWNLV